MAGIFISYRRDDSSGIAGRLYDYLSQHVPRDQLFIDVDDIPPGRDFADALAQRVSNCDVALIIIGPRWVNAVDENGDRRLDNPNDFVRLELEATLTREINVIPVLVDGATMPSADELPDSLAPLARRQAMEIVHTRFSSDAKRVVDALQRMRPAKKGLARVVFLLLMTLALAGALLFLSRGFFSSLSELPDKLPSTGGFEKILPSGEYDSSYKKVSFTCNMNGKCKGTYSGEGDKNPAIIIARFSPNGDMVGHWVEAKSDNRCREKNHESYYWGKILFRFDVTRNNWKGWWSYCDEKPNPSLKKRMWSGSR